MSKVSREELLLKVYESIKKSGGNEILDIEDFLRYLIDYFENSRDDIDKVIVLNVLLYLYNGE